MECARCGFDNLPIAKVCGACGAVLSREVARPPSWNEIHPPRARDRGRRRRAQARTGLQQAAHQLSRAWEANGVTAVLASAVVPGVGHLLLGKFARGLTYLAVSAGLLACLWTTAGRAFNVSLLTYLTLSAIAVTEVILAARNQAGVPIQGGRRRAALVLFVASVYFSIITIIGWILGWQIVLNQPPHFIHPHL